ncbi:vesicle transport protein GOT1A isoform X2 [Manacus vitellinus]|uniref:vesicle transport protein GOT1A isoform X2 n=1 Tax=Manacus vitellinus TaxID=328815 RepID=UPI0008472D90|nr:vesicle transport protein GOT1A isoform X2 [Manacus vitellinus]XP_051664837.1 vesicle transport protein GOT1A isoform X2 [Manacus candei]
MVSLTDLQRIGVGLVGFGLFFLLFGMLLYFDSVLLAFGNRPKLKGTSFFFGGLIVVLMRWPILGMLLEAYGFITLFRSFFPVALGFLGSLANIPLLSQLLQKVGDSGSMV